MSSDKIKGTIILEVLGKPPEHLNETLKNLIEKMNNEKGMKVVNSKINDPKLLKDKKDFYSNFAEIEIETEGLMYFARIIFSYMPSHIEISEPESIKMNNDQWGEIFNELTRKLHKYDEVARTIQNEKKILESQLKKYKDKENKEGNSSEKNNQ